MRIVTIQGSPKKDGNTAAVLALFEREVGDHHEIDHVDVADLSLVGCQGCYECQQNPNEPACATKDDMLRVVDRILAADAVVYATPLYMWGIASKMRGLMERHFCLVTGYGGPELESLVEGKKIAFLVTCGGPIADNADVIQVVFDRFADFGRWEVVGKYVADRATRPDRATEFAGDTVKKMVDDFGA
ncbi:MAG: flavodoxin family protein [Candidatus Eisenbacteria bacterium]|nr:flavodoxin family protein [Candidatus Eisenbacteria bacterium]